METGKSYKVSICIPTYNQTVYLDILLKSIARQTFTDFEIIVSDDSSTNEVKKLIDAFQFGEKLKYFRNDPSLGSPANWNFAIKKASGEYIKIMHHDDAFANDTALEEMMNLMGTNDLDYVFSDSKIENVKDPKQNRIHHIRKFYKLIKKPYLLFFGNSIGGPSALLIKKNKGGDLQYDPRYIWLVDIDYYIRLFQTSSKGGAISKPLVITHDATDHRLTTTILRDFELQVKEQIMLYNLLVSNTSTIPKFFMQVFLARLFYTCKVKNKELTNSFVRIPFLLKVYFSLIKIKPLYFAYYLVIRLLDLARKIVFR